MRMNIIKWDDSIYHRYIHRFPCIVHKKGSSSQAGKHKEAPTASPDDACTDIKTAKSISCGQTDGTDSSTALKTVPGAYEVCESDNITGIGVGQIIECDIIYGCISDL
ncbi:hypothetical protein DFR58_1339 [Anaerobacterium chartisolvens]|uniref:Uncharacterized protein n=1 Tax=Anaerobacterium chartisolvens TaxID=1297424 RepID=A0A369AKI2_9FIRM|nr:hypothetical protein [Anaerobacterium chartisolvens]RCX09870.1 hypothetical protein DFR58_1339 [Anaerobacterium chartisolvens]